MTAFRRLMLRALGMGLALLLPAASALAMMPGAATGGPPAPSLQRSPSPLIGFALMFFLLVAVIAVSIMPSRRGHQD